MTARRPRAAGLLLLAALLAGCSFKSVYNRLDYLIPKYVEGIVTLDESHADLLEQRTLLLLQWHRSTQLEQYAGWLRSLQQDFGPDLTEDRLNAHLAQLDQFWLDMLIKLNDAMAGLLPLLDADQRDELFDYLVESNAEFREEYVEIDDDRRIAGYVEYMTDTYENWIGDLNDEQSALVEQAATELVDTAKLRYRQRLAWQNGIRQILAERESGQGRQQRLREFLAEFEQPRESELQEKTRTNQAVIVRLTVDIAHGMTDEQADFFKDKTGEYIRIFTELAENR